MAEDIIVEVTEKWVLEACSSDKPCIVFFYTEWCGACIREFPVFEELKAKYGERAKFIKVDISKDKGTIIVPVFLFFKNGSQVERKVGLQLYEELVAALDSLLGS